MRNRLSMILILAFIATAAFAGGKKDQENTADSVTQPDSVVEQAEETPVDTTPGTPIQLGDADTLVATVNGVGILSTELERAVERTRQSYAAQGQQIADQDLELFRAQVLNQLVAEELLYQDGIANGFQVSEETLNLQYQQMREQFPTEEEWQTALIQNQTTEEELKKQLSRNDLIQQVIAVAVQNIPAPTDAEILAFYDANRAYFETGEQVTASHILISTETLTSDEDIADARQRAEDVRQELLNGADFAALAIEKSEGPSGPRGGELGTFGRGQMVAPFEETAFALGIGEISEVVQTQFGFHVIVVTERVEGGATPIEEVSGTISQYLVQQGQTTALQAYAQTLQSAADVELLTAPQQ